MTRREQVCVSVFEALGDLPEPNARVRDGGVPDGIHSQKQLLQPFRLGLHVERDVVWFGVARFLFCMVVAVCAGDM